MPDTITRIGRYEISRQLVDTALASVYDAFDPVERKPVAIRVPRGAKELDLKLKHPGLMTVLSYEHYQGEAFAVLEPFQGTSLETILHSGRKIEPADAISLLRQLASVLDYAHTHGSLHGSLHPSGILLNGRNEIKVLDLGAPATAGRNASPEQLLRAVHYLAPECVRDQPMEGRSDQYSLAVLSHRLLTGELPYAGKPLGVMFRIAYQGLERDAIRELPPTVQNVFSRALSKRPAERFSTCSEMVESLASGLFRTVPSPTRMVAAPEVPPDPRPAAAPARSGFFSRDGLKYFGVTFIVCAALLAALFYFLLPKLPKPIVATPAASQPVAAPPAERQAAPKVGPAPPPQSEAKARVATKAHAKKKPEPEVDIKPAEPKIIRQ
jgi:serine/threonine-protein kinase